MKHKDRPSLLLLTSSFPRSPSDETCGYIRDFARSLSVDFDVCVLALPDHSAAQWPADKFTLKRSRSLLPPRFEPLKAGEDLNALPDRSMLVKLTALVSLSCFFLRALQLSLRADAICSHWMVPSGLVGGLISRMLGKPHIVVEHSGAFHLLARMWGGRQIARFIIAASTRVITVSSDLERKLVALCQDASNKINVIPMGVTASSEASRAIATYGSTRTIVFIGRLIGIKGLDVLLTAMNGLVDVQLIVAGDGERREELESLARTLGVNAQFVGRVGAARRDELLANCDAVVIPSRVLPGGRTEGTPVSCLEAMSAGRVVIASRVGGLAEAIVDGENGLLFDAEDHRSLREKLVLILGDDDLRRRLGENARRSARAFDWARIGLRYRRIIDSALRKNVAIDDARVEASSIS